MKILFVLALLLLILGIGIGHVSPILKPFPELTGPYHIGIRSVHLADQYNIQSILVPNKRSLMVHIWYPTDNVTNLTKYPYLGAKMPYLQKSFSDLYHVPRWVAELFFRNINTHAYKDAPLSKAKNIYPVVLFSHGLLGLPSDVHVSLRENLASHGYIVIGIDHPYFNILTLYPDGKIISSQELSKQFVAMSSAEQKEFQTQAIDIYKTDIQHVLNQLVAINQNPNSIFYHHLDLEHIGIMGHSAGGTAAIELCRIDNRCKAAINLDGWYDHIISPTPLATPLLMLFGQASTEITEPTPDYLKQKGLTKEQYYARERAIEQHKKELCANSNCSIVYIPGASHEDFGDGALVKWPLRSWHADSYITIGLINKHINAFFDKYLE